MNEKAFAYIRFVCLVLLFTVFGCSALHKAIISTTGEQVHDMWVKTAPIANTLPTGYVLVGGGVLAVVGAVLKNLWDNWRKDRESKNA